MAAIIPAAGSGERFGADRNKLFAVLAGKPLWFHAASRLAARSEIGRIVMPISATDRVAFETEFGTLLQQLSITLVIGGEARTDSVKAGLDAIAGDDSIRWVAIHDAARPLISNIDLSAVFAVASQTGAAILATEVSGTIKRDVAHADQAAGQKSETVDRRDLWIALTPQVFRVGLLNEAYQKHNGRPATDDAQLVERIGHDVALVRGSADNLKITFPEDLLVAEAILARQANHA
jgi:2-C-methyl-D-erythritol 4-phosphate cytidylyltransferase